MTLCLTRQFLEKHAKDDTNQLAIVILLHDGEVLVGTDEDGTPNFPGGHIKVGESPEDGAWREFKEETTIDDEQLEFLTKLKHPARDGKETFVYVSTSTFEEKPHASSDEESLQWLSLNAATDQLDSTDVKLLAMAVQKIEQQQAKVKEALRVCGELGWFGFPPVDLTEAKKTKKGFLVVFEGIDGAGKSTQMEKIKKWLEKKNWHVDVTCWKSSPILGDAITQAKATKKLTPLVFSLLHAADMAWRYELEIKPALEKGHVVLCDRYCYTSYVRDGIRGISSKLLDTIYQDLPKPDVVFHLQVPVRTAVERLLSDKGVKWYSAGMDLGFSKDKEESLTIYEREMDKIYRKILPKLKGYQVISTNRSIDDIFEQIKGILKNLLKIVKD